MVRGKGCGKLRRGRGGVKERGYNHSTWVRTGGGGWGNLWDGIVSGVCIGEGGVVRRLKRKGHTMGGKSDTPKQLRGQQGVVFCKKEKSQLFQKGKIEKKKNLDR